MWGETARLTLSRGNKICLPAFHCLDYNYLAAKGGLLTSSVSFLTIYICVTFNLHLRLSYKGQARWGFENRNLSWLQFWGGIAAL